MKTQLDTGGIAETRVGGGNLILGRRAEDAASTAANQTICAEMAHTATCDVTRYHTSCGGGQGYEAVVLCGV